MGRDTSIAGGVQDTIKLNDGVEIPMFGFGTSKCATGSQGEAENAVLTALDVGYRMIDTASRYKNETDVGRAIRRSGLPREDVFIVTKLWSENHGVNRAQQAARMSLESLGFDYIDLYLIHSPLGERLIETYQALLQLKEDGLIRSVGVSNFGIPHLEGLRKASLPPPSVNQLELHAWQHKNELVQYCMDHDVTVMGYSPLAKAVETRDPQIAAMAHKHQKTYSQILVRWSVQKGFITIPKSGQSERIKENAQVFDWSLDDEDMDKIDSFPQWTCGWDPVHHPWNG